MKKFFLIFFLIFVIDQVIKYIFVNGFLADFKCFSLTLVFNKGVAFSMFAFLKEWLKYIQLVIIGGIFLYFLLKQNRFKEYHIEAGLLLGAAFSNLLDRFLHGGVVDYFYWHCYFDFAIFNFADVMIDLAVLLFFIKLQKKDPDK